MKLNYIIIALFLFVGIANVKGDYETTDWVPKGDQKFVESGTKVMTMMEGKTGHGITVGFGLLNVTVNLSPDARSKNRWILEEEKTIYRICGTGVPFGEMGIPYIEQKNGNFKFGFDMKEDGSNNGKSSTLYGQVILTGKHQKTKQRHVDAGVSGKDTSITITLKY